MEFKLIWLNGMPRSGTSWLSQIFDSNVDVRFKLSPLFSYAFKNKVDENSTTSQWEYFFEQVYLSDDEFLNQTNRRLKGQYPIFANKLENPDFLVIKDTRYHNLTDTLLKLFTEIKIIHIIRNPCGAINSWLKAPREFPNDCNPLLEWKNALCRKTGEEEFWGFNDWLLLTKEYLQLQKDYPNNVKVVSYEDLVEEPYSVTEEMFYFSGLKLGDETKKFIYDSQHIHNNNEYAVFKDKSVKDKWKQELHPDIIKEIKLELKNNGLYRFFKK